MKNEEENTIDIIAIAFALWKSKRKIMKIATVFFMLGMVIAIFSSVEYRATTIIVPQTGSKSIGGDISGLAAMAGVNIGSVSAENEIIPALYPKIVNSMPFKKELLKTLISIKGFEKKITLEYYYDKVYSSETRSKIKKYTLNLPSTILTFFKRNKEVEFNSFDNKFLTISVREKELLELLLNQIEIVINEKKGFVKISSKMPEPLASAELTLKIRELLQEYVINFRVQKSLDKLKFIEDRYLEKQNEFNEIQKKLAAFRDENQGVSSALAKTRLQVLESQYNLNYSVFEELSKQLEAQEIKVKEDTPVFSILEPITVPIDKASPKRLAILMIWSFLGVFVGVVFVLGKLFFKKIK